MRAPLLYFFLFAGATGYGQQIVTFAGMPPNHRAAVDGKNALDAPLGNVYGVIRDRITGRLLIQDQTMVERLEPDGTLLALAGIARSPDGETADGTPASNLKLNAIRGMAQDAAGNLYLTEAFSSRVFRIGTDGIVTTFAGSGGPYDGRSFEGQPATSVPLSSPRGLVFDSQGNLLVADLACRCIRRIDPNGILTTLYSLPSSPPPLEYIEGIGVDAAGNVYAAVYSGHYILKITPDGVGTIVAGTGRPGFSGDGGPATGAQLNFPTDVKAAAGGTLYIADTGNNRIRRITPDGNIDTIAGTGVRGFAGDSEPAIAARLNAPAQLLLDPDGTLYFGDFSNGRLRRITPDGIIQTIAGNGEIAMPGDILGDDGPAINARLVAVPATAFDSAGNLYLPDSLMYRVRKVAPDGTITTFAGNGNTRQSGDGGPAKDAGTGFLLGIAVDPQDNVYISTEEGRIRRIDKNGIITLVAGGAPGVGIIRSQGDEGPAVDATLNEPKGMAFDAAGNLYIADTSNARLRMVDRNGIIHLIAAAHSTLLGQEYWNGVAFDPQGRLYVSTTRTGSTGLFSLVSRVNPDNSLTPVAGNGQTCSGNPSQASSFDGKQALDVPLCIIVGIAFDRQGNLYIPESRYGLLLKVAPDGIVTRVAGDGSITSTGDGGPALNAGLFPQNATLDSAGNIFISQGGTGRIREITNTPLRLRLSADHLDLQGAQSQTVLVSTNFGEPFPYLVSMKTTEGNGWLIANRASGQTGEALRISANSAGLAPGVYHGVVTVQLKVATPQQIDLPVTLTVAR